MKNLLFFLLLSLFIGCIDKSTYPRCSYRYKSTIPENKIKDYEKFVTELVRAASQHMSGGDYEDVDDTIEEARDTAMEVYAVRERILIVQEHFDGTWSDALESEATRCKEWR